MKQDTDKLKVVEVEQTTSTGESKLLRVGQLAEQSGKTVRAMHLYEEMGLLRPALRTKGGFRLYSTEAVKRVELISRLQDADVSLAEIKEFLHDLQDEQVANAAMSRVRALFEKKLAEIRQQRMKLEKLEKDLEAGLRYLDACRCCGPEHLTSECGGCRLHGHDGNQPILVAGIHHPRSLESAGLRDGNEARANKDQ